MASCWGYKFKGFWSVFMRLGTHWGPELSNLGWPKVALQAPVSRVKLLGSCDKKESAGLDSHGVQLDHLVWRHQSLRQPR